MAIQWVGQREPLSEEERRNVVITTRITNGLHNKMKLRAHTRGVSMNTLVTTAVERLCAEIDAEDVKRQHEQAEPGNGQ
jgi:predicted HicB family RNase H-like nuclease